MTLVAAWVRHTPQNEELLVASDSRVSGAITLDSAPKIFRLERNDAVLAYCGTTLIAYPILLQIKAGLDAYEETRNRVIDIVDLKSHLEKVIEKLRQPIEDLPCLDQTNLNFKFLMAGYSWKTNAFRAWVFRYDISTGDFNAHSMPKKRQFIFMSDDHENELRAKKQLDQKSFDRKARIHKKLDWEPLKLLIDLIGDDTFDDIGGPPQLMKVYKHANTLPINVLWSGAKDCNGLRRPTFEITHLGRALLDYERNRYLTLDIETWEFLEPWKIRERLKVYREREKSQLKQSLRQTICLAIAGLRNKRDLQHRLTLMVANDCKNDEIFREITNYRFVENTV